MMLVILILSSVVWVRSSYQLFFVWSHRTISLFALLTVLLHLWLLRPLSASLETKIPLSASTLAWLATSVYRWSRSQRLRAYVSKIHNHTTSNNANVRSLRSTYSEAVLLHLKLRRTMPVHAGAYFYLYFHELPMKYKFRGYPMMAYGWEPLNPVESWAGDYRSMTQLTFLIQDSSLMSTLMAVPDIPITVEGPYGRDMRLYRFDTVCLVANGIGIAGILPIALSLADRNFYDSRQKKLAKEMKQHSLAHEPSSKLHRDRTRRLNIFWVLDNNSQISWITHGLTDLQQFDAKRVCQITRKFTLHNANADRH